jgi:hypothetical protein
MSPRFGSPLSALVSLVIAVPALGQPTHVGSKPAARFAVLRQRAPKEDGDEKVQFDLATVVDVLLDRLGPELIRHGPKDRTRKFRVGIFPFGNSQGRYPVELGDNGPALRGRLADALRGYLDRGAPGKFTVLYPEQLDEEIRASSADPKGISGGNLALARRLLRSFDLDVGVVGRFEVRSLTRPLKGERLTKNGGVRVQAKVILPEKAIEGASAIDPSSLWNLGYLPQPGAGERRKGERTFVLVKDAARRHSIRFLVKVDEDARDDEATAWKEVPLTVSAKDVDDDWRGHYYLVMPRAYQGKRYKLVLANHGKPPLSVAKSTRDSERLFGAAVLIDGVSCFMRHDGKQYRHVSDVPDRLGQWILTPVGKRIVPDAEGTMRRIKGGRLVEAAGKGDSEVHVLGFQKGPAVAGAFVLATAAESVAAPELLALRKIGTISVYFFAEKLADDRVAVNASVSPVIDPELGGDHIPRPGTAMGREVRSATLGVKVLNWHDGPVETWKILYRYKGDPSLPADLVPVATP